jgi:hypothetical protein
LDAAAIAARLRWKKRELHRRAGPLVDTGVNPDQRSLCPFPVTAASTPGLR